MRQTSIIAILLRLTVVFAFVLADVPSLQPNQAVYAQDATSSSSTPDTPAKQTVFLPLISGGSPVDSQATSQNTTALTNSTGTNSTGQSAIYLPLVNASAAVGSQTVDSTSVGTAPAQSNQVKAAAAINANVLLRVESARAWVPAGLALHQAIPHYHWLVVQDDTGDPTHYPGSDTACKPQSLGGDPAYPANCQWPSIHSIKGGTSAEVVAQGDETTLNATTGVNTANWPANDHNPNHSYMISVMAEGFDVPGCTVSATVTCHVDGFKIDGQWFTLPAAGGTVNVTVDMQPYPLPLTTVRMAVWNDLQTNGAYDTGEPNLAGFEGHIDDVLGPVTTDWFGNPLCTTYQHDSHGLMLYGTDGKPVVQQIGGHCFSDANGVITIPYLGPDRYASTVTPPNGQQWYQTSTLEGWHDWDTWSIEGWNGYDPEFVQGAEPFPFAEFGFVQVQSCAQGAANPSPGQTGACSTFIRNALGANAATAPNTATPTSHGSIKGTVVGIGEYAPQVGGANFGGQGKYIIENIKNPLISLIDTGRDDTTVYVSHVTNGSNAFQINNIPDGDYILTVWDEDQAYLLNQASVSIVNGQAVDMGVLDVAAWHSQVYGKVCNDTNRNGKCDTGEPGIPNLILNLLDRDNKVAFYGDNAATTDANGNYRFPRTYPLGQWVVTQGYWEQFYTVGVTYQTENQPSETTVMANGGFVDVSTFNLIGHISRLDWAVHPYETPTNASLGPTNGGIVGEVVASTTRNELDARMQAIESYEPGLPDATVHLYAPVKCDPVVAAPTGTNCTLETTNFGSAYYLTDAVDGSLKRLSDGADKISGNPIDLFEPYTSETWQRPTDCVARGAGGTPVTEQVLPPSTGDHDCLEAPLMASQVGNNSVGPFMQVNGNYGFTLIDHDPTTGAALSTPITIPPGDYLVSVDAPKDANGRPTYEVVKEEDINIFSGDQFVAPGETAFPVPTPNRTPPTPVTPAIPPFPCAGPLHAVHVVNDWAQALYDLTDPANPTKTGVYNPDMVDGGGSPYEGQKMPLCDTRLVTVRNGRSATPNFHFKTFSGFDATGKSLPASAGVPLPGRIFGIVVDDLNLSTNPKELFYGEKYGIPNLPVGIYDFSNRLVKTIQTDPDGTYEVILPSTSSYNCPLPAGPCPGIYRFLANDPGQPGHLNPGYNPAYRTIGGFFEVWPGVSLPSDLAPTPVAFGIENPATQQSHPAACLLNDPAQPTASKVPELFAVNKPYVRSTDSGAARNITINGQYFGTTPGSVTLTSASGTATTLALSGLWSDNQLTVVIPAASNSFNGPFQLKITGSNGQSTVNGITLHVLGGSGANAYNPTVIEVGPGKTFDPNAAMRNTNGYEHALQDALDNAAGSTANKLVVVYPGPTSTFNPFGSYFENVIIHSPIKLQGVGPGGIYTDPGVPAALLNTYQAGTVLDGLGYGTDSARDNGWQATLATITNIIGPNNAPLDPATVAPPEGEVILAVATNANQYTTGYKAAIDGLTIQNGDVMDFVPNVNSLGNGAQVGGGNNTPANPNQGGALVALAATRYLQVTNNIIRSNAGAYSALRLGTPLVGDNHLDGAHIANNRILNNGGSNLAGAVGIFNGAYGYEINNNDLCGNFSAEYGGAISHYGLTGNLATNGSRSNTGTPSSIHDNRIYFNGSYDEGGGVIIAGEAPVNPNAFGAGAGPVNIYNNLIEANLANDDGGGLRFLTAGNFSYNVYNNMIVNNISTHEGGGVAIDNAPNVRFYNNTVMRNLTTATAATSNGQPAPAGLSTATNSTLLALPAGSPSFSNPLLFNNIFWDNRAGTWDPTAGIVRGIGATDLTGVLDPTPINHWDMGVPGTTFQLSPTNSVLQSESVNHADVVASATNRVDQDPLVKSQYDTTINALPWRGNPNFIANIIVAQDVPVTVMGDYHLSVSTSPAVNAGANSKAVPTYQQPAASLAAPARDIDGDIRVLTTANPADAGADEYVAAAAAVASVTPTSLGFGNVIVGSTSGAQSLTLSNSGTAALTGINVVVTAPFAQTAGTCGATLNAGASCTINIIFSPTALGAATGSVTINASVTVAGSPVALTGTGVAAPSLPSLTVLDNFNRANANTLNNGTNWSQVVGNSTLACLLLGGGSAPCAAIRLVDTTTGQTSTGVASAAAAGQTIWNNPTTGFGTTQAAAFTFANATLNNAALMLKATGSNLLGQPTTFIQVRYNAGSVIVENTNNSGLTFTTNGTLTGSFANGDTLTALVNASGTVYVWKTTSANVTTYLGSATTGTTFTGTGRIGMQLPNGARVDNFAGGTVTGFTAAAAIFPQAPLLTNFSSANGPLDSMWAGSTGANNFVIQSNQVQSKANSGAVWWNPTSFSAQQEAFLTFTKLGKSANSTLRWQGLLLKLNGGDPEGANASVINVRYASNQGIQVRTKAPGQGWVLQAQWNSVTFKNGDRLGAQAQADGTVIVYQNNVSIGLVNVTGGPQPWPAANAAAGGQIGVQYNFNGGKFDDFGGGDMSSPLVAAAGADALGQSVASDPLVTEPEADDPATDDPATAGAGYSIFLPVVANQ